MADETQTPEISENPEGPTGAPTNETPEVGTVLAPDEPVPADSSAASDGGLEPEAPAETPDEAQEGVDEQEKVASETEGGVPDTTPRKPDASPSALAALIAEGEHITHDLLDEVEKRQDVGDVKYLVEFIRLLLGKREQGSEKSEEA